jgi:hypothetical protein
MIGERARWKIRVVDCNEERADARAEFDGFELARDTVERSRILPRRGRKHDAHCGSLERVWFEHGEIEARKNDTHDAPCQKEEDEYDEKNRALEAFRAICHILLISVF